MKSAPCGKIGSHDSSFYKTEKREARAEGFLAKSSEVEKSTSISNAQFTLCKAVSVKNHDENYDLSTKHIVIVTEPPRQVKACDATSFSSISFFNPLFGIQLLKPNEKQFF